MMNPISAAPVPATFLAASFLLAITPGPGVIYIVTRSVSQGRAAGFASVAGIALGNLGNGLIASLGLATLFAVSTLAFTLVKYVGAGYLIYLGIRMMLAPVAAPSVRDSDPMQSRRALSRTFGDGFLVALFNPKTALFFAAFLPQFLDPSDANMTGTLRLSVIFVLMAAVTDCAYAAMAGGASRWLVSHMRVPRLGRYFSGGAFIALGLFTALTGRHARS
ncbi:MAG TPA: LysE family translocator [Steroidobacteraceae bacterium]|nr:LysE family translocator [Steroidobacteraceae bacterium]